MVGVKTLINSKLYQVPADNAAGLNVINLEFPAFASMFGHSLAVLAGHGDLHGNDSF